MESEERSDGGRELIDAAPKSRFFFSLHVCNKSANFLAQIFDVSIGVCLAICGMLPRRGGDHVAVSNKTMQIRLLFFR